MIKWNQYEKLIVSSREHCKNKDPASLQSNIVSHLESWWLETFWLNTLNLSLPLSCEFEIYILKCTIFFSANHSLLVTRDPLQIWHRCTLDRNKVDQNISPLIWHGFREKKQGLDNSMSWFDTDQEKRNSAKIKKEKFLSICESDSMSDSDGSPLMMHFLYRYDPDRNNEWNLKFKFWICC